MTKYRIVEKKGEYKSAKEVYGERAITKECVDHAFTHMCAGCTKKDIYVPRYFVQSHIPNLNGLITVESWRDEKEFTDLTEARDYKRELELEEGIVIE